MKITKEELKTIIKEEIENTLKESREDHIKGISEKIGKLQDALANVTKAIANEEEAANGDDMILQDIRSTNSYFAKQQEQWNLTDKISVLVKQLRQLQDAPEGKGNVGQLARGD